MEYNKKLLLSPLCPNRVLRRKGLPFEEYRILIFRRKGEVMAHVQTYDSVEQFLDQVNPKSKDLHRVKGWVKRVGAMPSKPFKGTLYRWLIITDTQDPDAPELLCVFKNDDTKGLGDVEGNFIVVQGFCGEKEGKKRLASAKLVQDYDSAAPQATANAEENNREDSIMRQAALKALARNPSLAVSLEDVKNIMEFIDNKILPWFKGQKPEEDPFEDK
jgi:hypothetical protein